MQANENIIPHQRILRTDQYLAGFLLQEDDHTVTVTFKGQPIARFNALRVTVKELRQAADEYLCEIRVMRLGFAMPDGERR